MSSAEQSVTFQNSIDILKVENQILTEQVSSLTAESKRIRIELALLKSYIDRRLPAEPTSSATTPQIGQPSWANIPAAGPFQNRNSSNPDATTDAQKEESPPPSLKQKIQFKEKTEVSSVSSSDQETDTLISNTPKYREGDFVVIKNRRNAREHHGQRFIIESQVGRTYFYVRKEHSKTIFKKKTTSLELWVEDGGR